MKYLDTLGEQWQVLVAGRPLILISKKYLIQSDIIIQEIKYSSLEEGCKIFEIKPIANSFKESL